MKSVNVENKHNRKEGILDMDGTLNAYMIPRTKGFHKVSLDLNGLTEDEKEQKGAELFTNMPELEIVTKYLKKRKEVGDKFHILSYSPNKKSDEAKRQGLLKYYGESFFETIQFVKGDSNKKDNDKYEIINKCGKGEFKNLLFVDDDLPTIRYAEKNGIDVMHNSTLIAISGNTKNPIELSKGDHREK